MKSITKVVILIMVAAMSLTLVGCSGGAASLTRQPEGAELFTLTGEVEATVEGSQINVSGTTNIMDGAIYAVTLDGASGENLYKHTMTKSGDEFTHSIPLNAEWSGDVYVSIVCAPSYNGGQPDAVKEAYGDQFGNITGDNIIYTNEGNSFVALSEKITL